jgi:serralysin
MEFFAPCNVGFENEAFSLATNPSIPAGTDPGFVMVGRTNACGNSDVAVARLSANGNLDNSFSSDGKRILGDANYEVALSVRTSDWVGGNKITLAGYRNGGVGGSDFQVMRLNWNGSSDTSFSGDGKLTTDFNGSHDRAYSLNLSGNKIYVAGETRNGASYEFVIARYNAN